MDKRYQTAFKKHKNTLTYVSENLIDKIWDNRPSAPTAPVLVHPLNYSGQSTAGITSHTYSLCTAVFTFISQIRLQRLGHNLRKMPML
jgi:hypothetical protein